jgi:hypothetical protein
MKISELKERLMSRRPLTLLVVALLVPLGAAGASLAAARSSNPGGQTLDFTIEFSDFFLLDLGDHDISKGDQLIEADRLLNANGAEVGHNGLACTVTDPSVPEAACQGTFVLPGGQIAVQFLNSPPSVKFGAITGGTGRYRTARGQIKIVEPATGNRGHITFSISDE